MILFPHEIKIYYAKTLIWRQQQQMGDGKQSLSAKREAAAATPNQPKVKGFSLSSPLEGGSPPLPLAAAHDFEIRATVMTT